MRKSVRIVELLKINSRFDFSINKTLLVAHETRLR